MSCFVTFHKCIYVIHVYDVHIKASNRKACVDTGLMIHLGSVVLQSEFSSLDLSRL